jgi:hypothetical protein
MSTHESKEHEVAASSHLPGSQAKNGVAGAVILFFILGLAASLVVGWIVFPKLLYSQKNQPFSFNHVLHVEQVDDGCNSCHAFRDDGTFTGIPKLDACIGCHEDMQGDTEDEKIFVEQYVKKEREVPWLVYSKQPPCVFFSHAAHVKMGKMDCVYCHGPIGQSTHSRVYEQNRITGLSRDIWGKSIAGFKQNSWDRMKMDDCAECHARTQVGIPRQETKDPVSGHFLETVQMIFPTSYNEFKGTSVQTEKDGCFVCHK